MKLGVLNLLILLITLPTGSIQTCCGSTVVRDSLGRIIQVDNGDGTATNYTLDENGNRLNRERIDNRRSITVTIDPPASGAITGDGPTRLGAQASLSASPAGGFIFHHWSEGGATIGSDAALIFTVSVSRTLTAHFIAVSPIESWRNTYFGTYANFESAANIADPDRDGLSNLVEYAFGLNPTQSHIGQVTLNGNLIAKHGTPFILIGAGPSFHAIFGRRKDYLTAGLIYTVQFSSDLVKWENSTEIPTVLMDDGEIQAVSVAYPEHLRLAHKGYFRVFISIAP